MKSIKHRTEDVSDIKLTQTAIKFVREFVVIKKNFYARLFQLTQFMQLFGIN